MYCITTNTLCTTQNNVRYSALTDRLIYHLVWFRVLNFCLFCWLVNFILLQLCMYLSPVNSIHNGRRTAVRFEQEKATLREDFGGIALSVPYKVHSIETVLEHTAVLCCICTLGVIVGV